MEIINRHTNKELDSESSLADHGVRKYDNTTGRFITPDALWDKYYAWSPYHYSANNPVNMSDGNGYVINDLRITNEERSSLNNAFGCIRNLGLNYVNSILDEAEGVNSYIDLYSFKKYEKNPVISEISDFDLTKQWNSAQKRFNAPFGNTFKSIPENDLDADVILRDDAYNAYDTWNLHHTAFITLIDELHHAISQIDDENQDHINLYNGLKKDYESVNDPTKKAILRGWINQMKDQIDK